MPSNHPESDRFKVEPELDSIQIVDTSTGIVNVLSLAESISLAAQLTAAIDTVYACIQPCVVDAENLLPEDPTAAGESFRP